MISVHLDSVGSRRQVGAPLLKGSDNRVQFLIVYLLIEFGSRQGLTVEGDWIPLSIRVLLGHHTSYNSVRGVSFQLRRVFGVEVGQGGYL